MIVLRSYTTRPHELELSQGQAYMTVLFDEGKAIAFSLRVLDRVIRCRIVRTPDKLPRGYKAVYGDAARLTEELFNQQLRLALRQVIMP